MFLGHDHPTNNLAAFEIDLRSISGRFWIQKPLLLCQNGVKIAQKGSKQQKKGAFLPDITHYCSKYGHVWCQIPLADNISSI